MHSNSFTPGCFIKGNSTAPASMPPTWHHQATSLLVAAPRLMNWIAMNTPMIQYALIRSGMPRTSAVSLAHGRSIRYAITIPETEPDAPISGTLDPGSLNTKASPPAAPTSR